MSRRLSEESKGLRLIAKGFTLMKWQARRATASWVYQRYYLAEPVDPDRSLMEKVEEIWEGST